MDPLFEILRMHDMSSMPWKTPMLHFWCWKSFLKWWLATFVLVTEASRKAHTKISARESNQREYHKQTALNYSYKPMSDNTFIENPTGSYPPIRGNLGICTLGRKVIRLTMVYRSKQGVLLCIPAIKDPGKTLGRVHLFHDAYSVTPTHGIFGAWGIRNRANDQVSANIDRGTSKSPYRMSGHDFDTGWTIRPWNWLLSQNIPGTLIAPEQGKLYYWVKLQLRIFLCANVFKMRGIHKEKGLYPLIKVSNGLSIINNLSLVYWAIYHGTRK